MPELHPDWMLLLFFTHTHLTVTVTLGLLLIPKVNSTMPSCSCINLTLFYLLTLIHIKEKIKKQNNQLILVINIFCVITVCSLLTVFDVFLTSVAREVCCDFGHQQGTLIEN